MVYLPNIWACTLALYIQGNFIFTDYGHLDGRAIDWSSYKSEAIINTIIWIVCIVSPFVLRFFKKLIYNMALISISAGIIMVQLITLGTLLLTTNFKQNEIEFYLSTDGLYEVSEEENVVIFILDTFDVTILREIMQSDPTFMDSLDGFTNYNNAVGGYPITKVAIPHILTGQYYKNEQKYSDYLDEAFSNSEYYGCVEK